MKDREPPAGAAPAFRRRFDVAAASLLHCVVLGGGAATLSFRGASAITLLLGAAALLHLSTAVAALVPWPRAFVLLFRAAAVLSLALFGGLTLLFASSALYVRALYQGVGPLVAAALVVVWGVLVLMTVPFGLWGVLSTRGAWKLPSRAIRGAAATLIVFALGSAFWVTRAARATPVAEGSEEERRRTLEGALRAAAPRAGAEAAPAVSLFTTRPAVCERPPAHGMQTILATFLGSGGPQTICVQADTPSAAGAAIRAALGDPSPAGGPGPVKVDWITAVHVLDATTPLLDALKIRPELDGVCAYARCLAPWQLIAMDAFTQHRPVDAVRDMSFGVSVRELRRLLGGGKTVEGLLRVETASYVWDGAALHPLRGVHPPRTNVTSDALHRATARAEAHIAAAQGPDGTFRYTLDPFGGRANTATLNVRRHAGTTLALCESPQDRPRIRGVAERALSVLAELEQADGPRSALSEHADRTSVGDTALGLAAFLGCRPLVGDRHDALLGKLARFLLAGQRDDGSFAPRADLHAGTPAGEGEAMYTSGQAMLALVQFESLVREAKHPDWPQLGEVERAVQRGMDHYASDYWPWPLSDFFYLEENWHCLAARAALRRHRHDGYERFCLDYVTFKARLILGEHDADPLLHGAYGLGNVFPPHNTATAGYGEALAAALAVSDARREARPGDRERMKAVLGFLLTMQWDDAGCFACTREHLVTGGFSEHYASPTIRIDYVQHALSAMRHGGRVLAARPAGEAGS